MKWKRFNGKPISEPIFDLVERTIQEELEAGNKLKVCIGTDSQKKATQIDFATVIVFLREKKGGFMYICTERSFERMSLKKRMIDEVAKSVRVAYHLHTLFDKYNVEIEVHADINSDPQFESNVAWKEAMGYILGMGFVFKSKPEAFASSCCADKLV